MSKEAMKLALEALENSRSLEPVDVQWVKGKRHAAITALREALAEQALDKKAENARKLGLDYEPVWNNLPSNKDVEDAMRLKRLSRLAEQPAQQEPVAWRYTDARGHYRYRGFVANFDKKYPMLKPQPLYTSPIAQRTWVGLTDEDIDELFEYGLAFERPRVIYREIEAKLKEKNT